MTYKHPNRYAGSSENNHVQFRTKQFVESNCLKCENFMGKEHNFEDCSFNIHKRPMCNKSFKTVDFSYGQNLKYESED